MSIIELIFLVKTDGERILLNMLLFMIITGLRFQEVMTLRCDALVKREIADTDKLRHAREQGLPDYKLGIKYLGAKKAGWRIHWLAPSTNTFIESIFDVPGITIGLFDKE